MGPNNRKHDQSRRAFLKQLSWAHVMLLPAPVHNPLLGLTGKRIHAAHVPHFPFADVRFTPHYPEKSALDDLLRLAAPGSDEYVVEGYASHLIELLADWSQALRADPPGLIALQKFVSGSMQSTPLTNSRDTRLRSGPIEVLRRQFPSGSVVGREKFLQELKQYLAPLK